MFSCRLEGRRLRSALWVGVGLAPFLVSACSGSPASTSATPPPADAPSVAPGASSEGGGPANPVVPPPAAAPAAVPGAPVPGAPPAPSEPEAQQNGQPPLQPPAAGGSPGASEGEASNGAAGDEAGGKDDGIPLDPELATRCSGTNPIRCAFDVPNGNYDVSVEVGDDVEAAVSRISAETRHYAGPAISTAAGASALSTFTLNVRPEVHDGGQSAPGGVLDLLIDGPAPKLRGIGLRPAPSAVTVFIASDSTAADWVSTNASALAADETGWAQVLSMYFERGVAVANYADSGETSGSFYDRFFAAARDSMKAGDYLFIQFGHNNKQPADIASYGDDLLGYLNDARAKGVTPVIFTPVSRLSGTAQNPGFNGLDQVARDLAAREGVALIDLTALSRDFYASVGDRNALSIDGTHFHEVGAIGVAGVVAQAIARSDLPLASFVKGL